MASSSKIFALLFLSTFQFATSYATPTISKRANPIIGPGFTDADLAKVQTGFADACTLAHAAVTNLNSGDLTIFHKYFLTKALDNVKGVFTSIVSNNPDCCSTELSSITVRPDFAPLSCTKPWFMGATRDGEKDNPTMILCPAGLAHPSISEITCDSLDPRTSYKMEPLGATILHEYTHCEILTHKFLPQGTRDTLPDGRDVYGSFDTQDLQTVQSGNTESIADSYTWFAIEAFWSKKCGKSYGLSTEKDSEDPLCHGQPCEDGPSDS